MLKIGDFARISGINAKTLRYYDDIGLIKPAQTDPATGYRYYALDQIKQIDHIQACKAMGLSLDQIALLMQTEPPETDLRALLLHKRGQLAEQFQALRTQILNIDRQLHQMECEGDMSAYDVTIKPFTPDPDGEPALPRSLPQDGTFIWIGEREGGLERNILFTTSDLPRPEALACAIHRGHPRQIHDAYLALGEWITAQGYVVAAPPREIYLRKGDPPDDAVIEIQLPVARKIV